MRSSHDDVDEAGIDAAISPLATYKAGKGKTFEQTMKCEV